MATILIIDDEPQVLWLLRKMLTQDGHTVISAKNGAEGYSMYKSSSIDLIITDMVMPEKSGLKFIAELIREQPAVRIIAISGGGAIESARYLSLAKSLGARRILTKPFSREDLINAVHEVLA